MFGFSLIRHLSPFTDSWSLQLRRTLILRAIEAHSMTLPERLNLKNKWNWMLVAWNKRENWIIYQGILRSLFGFACQTILQQMCKKQSSPFSDQSPYRKGYSNLYSIWYQPDIVTMPFVQYSTMSYIHPARSLSSVMTSMIWFLQVYLRSRKVLEGVHIFNLCYVFKRCALSTFIEVLGYKKNTQNTLNRMGVLGTLHIVIKK